MRIAQVAPLAESVPPKTYGGTERIVSYLTEELVRLGHEVTLFASGDSSTAARLIPCIEQSLRGNSSFKDPLAALTLLLERVFQKITEFDIVHFHIDHSHFPLTRRTNIISVTTMHGRMDSPELVPVFQEFKEIPLVSISRQQRKPLPFANWVRTVPHGLPEHLYEFGAEPKDYLIFLGRICPEKRPDRAIELAKRTGHTLKIAAKVDDVDREYFESRIKPMLDSPLVEFIGEVGEDEKNQLLKSAAALLFPIDWPEPFGLVMIESLATGTPVIAYDCGSVREIVENGKTGFIVRSMKEAERAIESLGTLSRRACREAFEERFTVGRMASNYLNLYEAMKAPRSASKRLVAGARTRTAGTVENAS